MGRGNCKSFLFQILYKNVQIFYAVVALYLQVISCCFLICDYSSIHREVVRVLDHKDHGLAGVDLDLPVIVIVEHCGLVVISFALGPSDMDHPSVCDVISVLAVFLDPHSQIRGSLNPGLGVHALDQHVVKSHLLAGCRVALRLAVESLIILAVLFVVHNCGLCHGEASLHIHFLCADRIRILLQCISLLGKREMLLVVVVPSVLERESGLFDRLADVLRICVRRVLGAAPRGDSVEAAVIGAERSAYAVDIVCNRSVRRNG